MRIIPIACLAAFLLAPMPIEAQSYGTDTLDSGKQSGMSTRRLREEKLKISKIDTKTWQRRALAWVAVEEDGNTMSVTPGKGAEGIEFKKGKVTGDDVDGWQIEIAKPSKLTLLVPLRGQNRPLKSSCSLKEKGRGGDRLYAGVFQFVDGGLYCLWRYSSDGEG